MPHAEPQRLATAPGAQQEGAGTAEDSTATKVSAHGPDRPCRRARPRNPPRRGRDNPATQRIGIVGISAVSPLPTLSHQWMDLVGMVNHAVSRGTAPCGRTSDGCGRPIDVLLKCHEQIVGRLQPTRDVASPTQAPCARVRLASLRQAEKFPRASVAHSLTTGAAKGNRPVSGREQSSGSASSASAAARVRSTVETVLDE